MSWSPVQVSDKWLTGKVILLNDPMAITFFAADVNRFATDRYLKQSVSAAIHTGSGIGTFLSIAKSHPELPK